jgi:hypothetical protein
MVVALFWYLMHGVPASLLTARRSLVLGCLESPPKYTPYYILLYPYYCTFIPDIFLRKYTLWDSHSYVRSWQPKFIFC